MQCSPDHLRLLLSLKPEQALSRVVQMFKGNISRQFWLVYPDVLTKHQLKRPLAAGYFGLSAGKADLEAVRCYVAQQAAHHGYRGEWTSALTYRNPDFHSPAFSFSHSVLPPRLSSGISNKVSYEFI